MSRRATFIQLLALSLCAVSVIALSILAHQRGEEWVKSSLSRNVSYPLWSLVGSQIRALSLFSGGGHDGGGGDDGNPGVPALFYMESEMTVFAAFLKRVRVVEKPLYFSEKQRMVHEGYQQSYSPQVNASTNSLSHLTLPIDLRIRNRFLI